MALVTKIKEWFAKPPAKSETKAPTPKVVPMPKKIGWSPVAQTIGLSLLVSEKSMNQQAGNVVVFRVKPAATKGHITQAVREQYGVEVQSVRTAKFLPKARVRGRTIGLTNHWKKAYVTVNDITALNLAP